MDPSCYNPQGQIVGGGWQGMSIKDILEKVDLFNFGSLGDEDNGKKKDKTNEGPITPDLKVCVFVHVILLLAETIKTFKIDFYSPI